MSPSVEAHAVLREKPAPLPCCASLSLLEREGRAEAGISILTRSARFNTPVHPGQRILLVDSRQGVMA